MNIDLIFYSWLRNVDGWNSVKDLKKKFVSEYGSIGWTKMYILLKEMHESGLVDMRINRDQFNNPVKQYRYIKLDFANT